MGIGTLPPPFSPANVPLPPRTKGGRHPRLRVRGCGSSISDEWRKSLALYLLCGCNPQMTWSNGCRASLSRSHTKKTCRSWPVLKSLHFCFFTIVINHSKLVLWTAIISARCFASYFACLFFYFELKAFLKNSLKIIILNFLEFRCC